MESTTFIDTAGANMEMGIQPEEPQPVIEVDPEPTEEDFHETGKIKYILDQVYNQFETQHAGKQKRQVLAKLNKIIIEWVKQCGREDNQDEETIENSGGALVTFGSFKLGVAGPSADIDTLCVVPKHITKDHFFKKLVPTLNSTFGVSNLTAVESAFVPVIKFEFDNVEIDLLLAKIQQKQVNENPDLHDNNIFRGCTEQDVRSLNGSRVTEKIHTSVPNNDNFKITLMCIKLWAKNRGIYTNVQGYLGGIGWAILVAKICILHPTMLPNQLLNAFFKFYRDYNYNSQNFISLETKIYNDREIVGFDIPCDMYEPNQKDVMPIITPAFPAQNATHGVSHSTKSALLTEYEKAAMITEALIAPGAGQNQNLSWKRLFKKFPFFKAYSHFIEIQILSKNKEAHGKWCGFVESKNKAMIKCLETFDERDLKIAGGFTKQILEFRPWTHSCQNIKDKDFPVNNVYYIGIRVRGEKELPTDPIDLRKTRRTYYDKIFDGLTRDESGLMEMFESTQRLIDIRVSYKTRAQLPDEVRPKETKPAHFETEENSDFQSNLLGRRQAEQNLTSFEQPESYKRAKN